jgi:hypothetical protein
VIVRLKQEVHVQDGSKVELEKTLTLPIAPTVGMEIERTGHGVTPDEPFTVDRLVVQPYDPVPTLWTYPAEISRGHLSNMQANGWRGVTK